MSNKAIYVQPGGGYDKVEVGTCEATAPGVGEITVRLHASSLNYHDFAVVSGMWGPAERRIPMADGAGEVIAVGSGVSDFQVGDSVVSTFFPDWLDGEANVEGFARVPGDGLDGYARGHVTALATAFTRAPKGFSHAEAATLTTAGLTAWRALMSDDHLKPGDTVLVQGTGGVSIFALQFAKLAGASVIATSSSDAKLERLKALGADHVINYTRTPAWGEKVRELTDNRGVDHVIEVGGPATLEQSMIAARIGGHVSLIGILTGVAGQLPLVQALVRQIRLQGVLVGSRAQQQAMVRAIEANGLRPVVDKHFELEHIVDAFRYQESNRHFGKICLTW
ncbi:NAD(P)-dependent alcohol dehydrogenase [Pseudomonas fulva]|uniref:NAD(P)-dependent alcohol dehydrogenase n=1 Tax=Pseudomonas fulva TaxID=47880 RepID=A0A7S9Q8G8_9PSED|nr:MULTISPECIES: NAD(P)-dependent alcohol dehydrogenase [Pseudomonas]QPH44658.1 NAD(P)-dependent alcohol dehydrogenase [Pseudomonas fulva]QPH49733.1 NAD(P)-dependent alcohol dehydrogenase [Pseudomonas fulva]RDL17822.1 NADPH:quinone reductase-like Zn-dependent oxidoreductase [Pseudomonas sp. LAMO17WK12:I3]RED02564.1 NADPH:quinone reductase-like Zn-dependent oxidoreductase [Pseudomonas sp. URMO17WK12:I10]CRN05556.1 Alcohol dehydrogenase [Pseudomonas sp. URMO17WK12:I11]